ncbi:hypothetical protein JXA85_02150 [Candidatus Woesearchaeota archaeon]|nr:hypothetical protein [Candidatus Woesearchaeota archaeon]
MIKEKEKKEALKEAKRLEKKHIPTSKELREEDAEFKKESEELDELEEDIFEEK